MIKNRGTVEKEIAGKKIGFKFNMAAFEMIGDLQDMTAPQLIQSASTGKLSTLAAFLYSGAIQYCKQEKKLVDFTRDDSSEWLNELGLKEVIRIFTEAIDIPRIEGKNEGATVTENGALKTA